MTLTQWCIQYDHDVHTTEHGAKYLLAPDKWLPEMKWDLHHLSDYTVSSICGLTIWLNRRENRK